MTNGLSFRAQVRLNYAVAFALLLSPFLFGFASVDRARNVFAFAAALIVAYSIFGVAFRRRYGLLDGVVGLALAGATLLPGYLDDLSRAQVSAHFGFALGLILIALSSRPQSSAVG